MSQMFDKSSLEKIAQSLGTDLEKVDVTFHSNGNLASIKSGRDRASLWSLSLSEDGNKGVAQRLQAEKFPEQANHDQDTDKYESSFEWSSRWIQEVLEQEKAKLRCDFCGTGDQHVANLVSGKHGALICDHCIHLFSDFLDEAKEEQEQE